MMHVRIRYSLLVLISVVIGFTPSGAGGGRRGSPGGLSATLASPPALRGYDPQNLDSRVSPCTDFYQFAVGGWRARNPIPPDYPSWGIAEVVERRNQQLLRRLLE